MFKQKLTKIGTYSLSYPLESASYAFATHGKPPKSLAYDECVPPSLQDMLLGIVQLPFSSFASMLQAGHALSMHQHWHIALSYQATAGQQKL